MTLAPEHRAAPPATDTVTVTIDGFELRVPKGTLIIRAAERAGLQIPRFCDHPLLDPVGACRQCIVEVEGQRKPVASCTMAVADGMVIRTQLTSQVAEKAQRGNIELLLINHPLDCPICDKGGECPLQNQAMSSGGTESRFTDTKRTYPKPVAISAQILLDRERCVLCARCTRFSEQIAGDPFIELFERGPAERVAVAPDQPLDSYFSGNTVQICPVGALTSARYRFRARPFDLRSTPSVCEHCSSGCAQRTDWRRGEVTRRLAGEDPEVNEEWNCDKGRFAFVYPTLADRISTPLVRDDNGELVAASWPDALERAAQGLASATEAGGVGVLPGGRLTTEDAYAYAKFARVALGTNDIDMRARPGGAEELDFLAARVAGTGLGVTYADLEAAPTVLLAGFDPEEESPIVFLRLRKTARTGTTSVYAIAPYRTDGLRKTDGTLIQTPPGGETRALVTAAEPDGALGAALRQPGAVILVGERLAETPGALSAACALARATGAGLAWVPRRAGERGAADAGALPTLLPGGRMVTDPAGRDEVSAAWGAPVPAVPGRDLTAILTAAANGELGGLLVGGLDPADLPDPDLATRALDAVGFLVSLEQRRGAVTARADVVFPVAPAAEKTGTYVNWEGRARPFEATLRTSAVPDARVLRGLADDLDVDVDSGGIGSPEALRAELAELGTVAYRPDDPREPATGGQRPGPGQALLATWHALLDNGSMQDGEPHLAGTRRDPVVRLSPATAAEIGGREGQPVTVGTERGRVTLPLRMTAMPDRVVWVPTNSPGSAVRATLGAGQGALVDITAEGGDQ